jgi:hypothetical protein
MAVLVDCLLFCLQLETVEGVVILQGKYDTVCRELENARGELSAAKVEAEKAAATVASLERQLDERVQEVVCARGEIESLTTLAQALHEALTASNSGGEGKFGWLPIFLARFFLARLRLSLRFFSWPTRKGACVSRISAIEAIA